MRLKVINEYIPIKEQKEVFFRLDEYPMGANESGIALRIVSREGGILNTVLTLESDGVLFLNHIDKIHGLQLDERGRIKLGGYI